MSQAFNFQLISHGKEGVKIILSNTDLTMVHEVQHGDQVCVLYSFEVEERVRVRITLEDYTKERGASSEDHFVGLHLIVITGQGDIKEVVVIPEFAEG